MSTDGWTDMTKLIVAFCNFADASENCCIRKKTKTIARASSGLNPSDLKFEHC
jgi:hypothetical protein